MHARIKIHRAGRRYGAEIQRICAGSRCPEIASGLVVKIDIEIAGGIKIGTSQKDLEAALKKMGVKYEKEDEGSYMNYSLENDDEDSYTNNYITTSDGKVNDINIQYEPDSLGN